MKTYILSHNIEIERLMRNKWPLSSFHSEYMVSEDLFWFIFSVNYKYLAVNDFMKQDFLDYLRPFDTLKKIVAHIRDLDYQFRLYFGGLLG